MNTITGGLLKVFFVFSFIWVSQVGRPQVHKIDSVKQIQLSEVVVSALRLPHKENSVPFGIAMMKSRINTQGLSLAENVAGLPGIEVNTRYNYAVGDRVTNRGFGTRTQFGVRGVRIVQDDMPVTFADGQSNLEMIDFQDISYVELLKGPGSSLYGNASGGVLFLHTNPLSADQFLSSVSSTIGSNGLFRWNGSVGGEIGKTQASVSFADFRYDGFRQHASANYKRSIVKFLSTISQSDVLQIYAGYVDFNGLNPGSLTKQEFNQDPSKANPMTVSNAAGQDGNQEQIATTWKHQRDSSSMFKVTGYGVHRSVVNPIIGKIVVLPQNSGGVNALYGSRSNIFGERIDWSAGAEMAFRLNFRKNYVNNNGNEGNLTINQDEQIIGTGIYLQALVPVTSKIDVDGSIRYDRIFFGVNNKLNSNNNDSRRMNGLSPSIGLIYRVLNNFNFFANLSTSFETPTSTELANRPGGVGGFNPDLNPSHAIEYEAGFRGAINNIVKYDLTGYIINTKDDLIPFEIPSASGQDYYRNAGSTVHRGGELMIRYFPFNFLDAIVSLTYIDAYFKNYTESGTDQSGKKIPGITPVRASAEIKFHALEGFYSSVLAQGFGKVYADDANTASAGPHAVFDFGIGHEGISSGKSWMAKLILSGGISNIFNTRYISAVTINAAANRYYEPGSRRAFYLNARLEFGKP